MVQLQSHLAGCVAMLRSYMLAFTRTYVSWHEMLGTSALTPVTFVTGLKLAQPDHAYALGYG
jgi:hypothetical protein